MVVALDINVTRLSNLHPSPETEQLVILTLSGLVWFRHSRRQHPLTLRASLIDALCTEVLRVMSVPHAFLVPLVLYLHMVPPRRVVPLSVALGSPGSEELRAHHVASWLVRADLRVRASSVLSWDVGVHLPVTAQQSPPIYTAR